MPMAANMDHKMEDHLLLGQPQQTPPPGYPGYIPPPPGFGTPPAGYGPPTPGYGPPLSAGSVVPPPGYGTSPAGYGPSPAGYGLPPPGYRPPLQGYLVMTTQPAVSGICVAQNVNRPPDNMLLSIISCCFCWPLAICSIIYSCNSRTSSDNSDFETARQQGQIAKNIATSAICVGIIIMIIMIACIVIPIIEKHQS